MADTTVVDTYAKAATLKAQAEEIAKNKTDNGAKSSIVTEDDTNWIITTVWPG
jgi:hypothetical protein